MQVQQGAADYGMVGAAISLAELSVGPLVPRSDAERIARQSVFQQVEADFHPIPFDDRAARAFGRVAAQLRASGRKTTAPVYDALIAATAVANDLPVFTRNPDGFAGIASLTVVALDAAP
ncbi:MAG: PIN domain-containing protein [Sporichthyaceae bacterium]